MASTSVFIVFLFCVRIPVIFTIEKNQCINPKIAPFMDLNPTGRKNGGVPKSQDSVEAYMDRLEKYYNNFKRVGKELDIHPALLAALASRESNFGASLKDGWGDNNNGYGMMQIDVRNLKKEEVDVIKSHKPDSYEHVLYAGNHFKDKFQEVKNKFPSWSLAQQIQGAVAAYNFGVSNVRSWENLDVGTTGNDYSNDVIARAQYLVSKFNW